jgi:RNA polymerase primary sigma factor
MGARRLTQAEEIRLATRIGRGDPAAREALIESNLGLVRAIARSFRGTSASFDDLVQDGTIGLVQAVERFDHRRGVRFSTYAAWWVRRAILDAIDNSELIRTPAKARRQMTAVRRAEDELARTQGPASDEGISAQTGLSTASVQFLRTAAHVTASLDEPVGEDARPLLELVADQSAVDPSEDAIEHENRDEVKAMVRLLPARHREVVVRRFGLNGAQEQSHAEIAEWLGLGEERSRQLEREALHRLRSIAHTESLAA